MVMDVDGNADECKEKKKKNSYLLVVLAFDMDQMWSWWMQMVVDMDDGGCRWWWMQMVVDADGGGHGWWLVTKV